MPLDLPAWAPLVVLHDKQLVRLPLAAAAVGTQHLQQGHKLRVHVERARLQAVGHDQAQRREGATLGHEGVVPRHRLDRLGWRLGPLPLPRGLAVVDEGEKRDGSAPGEACCGLLLLLLLLLLPLRLCSFASRSSSLTWQPAASVSSRRCACAFSRPAGRAGTAGRCWCWGGPAGWKSSA